MIINTYQNLENQIQAFNIKNLLKHMYSECKNSNLDKTKKWNKNLNNQIKIMTNFDGVKSFGWKELFKSFIKKYLKEIIKNDTQFIWIFKKVGKRKNNNLEPYLTEYLTEYSKFYKFIYTSINDITDNKKYVKLYEYKNKEEAIKNREEIKDWKINYSLMLKIIKENWK